MARDPQITEQPGVPGNDAGKPDVQNLDDTGTADQYAGVDDVDKPYWLSCMDDAERAEQDWRKRGREVVQIYRNEGSRSTGKRKVAGDGVTFNILYANTEVMLPAVYQKPPKPVVRSRFTKSAPPMPPPMVPPMAPPGMMPPGGPSMGPLAPNVSPVPPGQAPLPGGLPGGPPVGSPPIPAGPPGLEGVLAAPGPPMPPGPMPAMGIGGGPGAPPGGVGAPPVPPMGPPMMGPPPPPPAPPAPPQDAIETAASIMEKALEIVVDDEASDEAIQMAIKDVLLPGRGTCRVRWKPEMKTVPVMSGDGATPLPAGGVAGAEPATEDRKVWEEVADEYVYWEDLLVDPVRAASDCDWMAFRHLFTKEALEKEFAGSPQYEVLKTANKLDTILKWTDESAAKSPVGGGSAIKTARNLGDHVRKAMVWEIWSRPMRQVIWFIRETSGLVLRVDPDTLGLQGFYPSPVPMLSVTTTDSRIPRPYFDLYADLATDLDETSKRISAITKQIKARGAYNAASKEIADLLTAGDNKMVPVEGVDMINGGLQNHIWMMPIELYVGVLTQLYIARDQVKQAIYEIMGISDIMRGATKATETATAQRIKGSMGMGRLEDQKQAAANFVRDLLRLKAEIIAKNFDPETLAAMTGEEVTPEVMALLRSDFARTCSIDIESDSTVVPDQQAEQEGMAMIMQSVQLVMQGTQSMLMTQILPPQQVINLGLELLKMALHPVRYSRGVVEMINDFQAQLQQQMMMQAMMPPPPPMMPPGIGHNGGPPMGDGPPPPSGPSPGNGGMPAGMPPPPMM
jgi:hypothetical protein